MSLRLCVRSTFKTFHKQNSTFIMPKSAGIIVIGDEILKGQTKDTNSIFLCQLLHSLGVSLKRITVIGDDIQEISNEVRIFSNAYDYVLTSGGIGPTHDDKTFDGVANAFNESVVANQTLVDLCTRYFGNKPMNSPEMKMAHIPESAVLHFGHDASTGRSFRFPVIAVKNVFLFPGIPSLLEKSAVSLKHLFKGEGQFYTNKILVDELETGIAKYLSACQEKYHSVGVAIGSYPDLFNNYYKVKVVVESVNSQATEEATKYLMDSIPQHLVVKDYVENPTELQGKDVFKKTFTSQSLSKKVDEAVQIIEEALRRYSFNELCIGFNGGKDCTALLHLFYAVLCRKYPEGKEPILSLYVKDPNPFDEVRRFMEESCKRYKLKLVTIDDKIKPALEKLKLEHPEVKATLMGTRYTDPYSRNLAAFSPTDDDWPSYMRVNPMLDWSYHDVWEFLRSLHLPYCVLYDRGYTSLGSKENTKRNEKLMYIDEDSRIKYRQAYTLQDEDFERNGRL
uniref:FAD synthase-like isoform X1 n=1 Tax=Styela clava TaxID=7725 RepID=UPI00193AC95A|nr:FAD synthase-like isoform X1 [Styela clava]